MRRWWLGIGLGLLSWSVGAGCTTEDGDDTECGDQLVLDAAPAPADDGADSGPEDAGKVTWMPKDAGQRDANVSENPTPVVDSGQVDTRMCAMPRQPLPSAVLPRCSAQTGECMDGCQTADDPDACRSACLDADVTPPEGMYGLDCKGCIYLQLFACIEAAGCHDAVADTFCCLAEKCPTGSPENCGDMNCPNEINTAVTCGYFADMSCTDFSGGLIAQCYADSDADAGQ